MEVFETIERKSKVFSKKGNGQHGNIVKSGWRKSRLGNKKKRAIIQALKDSDVDKVYMKNGHIYKSMLNGRQIKIN